MRAHELIEGVDDPHIFKAIIMAGAPASGKTTVVKKLTGGSGLKMVDSDAFLKIGIHDHSRRADLSIKQLNNYIEGRLGIVIDGTGHNVNRILSTKRLLDFHGYETLLVFVDVDLENALLRNIERDRNEDPKYVSAMWKEMENKKEQLRSVFGGNMVVIDNRPGVINDWNRGWKIIKKWLERPVNTPYAQDWKHSEHRKKSLGEDLDNTQNPIAMNQSDADKVIFKIKKECSQYLGMINPQKHQLFRGLKLRNYFDAMEIPGTRENRKALDTPKDINNIVIKAIKESGLVANRNNSWFATGSSEQADFYGKVYVAFPTDGFHYTWSPNIDDLYGMVMQITEDGKNPVDEIEGLAYTYQGDDGSLADAIEFGYEIMFTSPKVILIQDEFYRDYIKDQL